MGFIFLEQLVQVLSCRGRLIYFHFLIYIGQLALMNVNWLLSISENNQTKCQDIDPTFLFHGIVQGGRIMIHEVL